MKFLVPVDLTKNELQNARIQNLPSAPGTPVEGQIYYNTTAKDVLFYDGNTWVSTATIASLSIDGLDDVVIANVADKQYFVYDSATSKWVNADLNINDIVELNVSSPVDGDFLVYDNATSKWVNLDVDSDDIEEGATNLYYTNDRADARIAAASIDDLSDVVISGTSAGDLLVWNGSQWVNQVVKISDLADPNANVSMNNFNITNLATPTQAGDAATKEYVDAVSEGLHIHASVVAATTDTLAALSGDTVTYSNGTNGIGATLTLSTALSEIDGITLSNGDRVLVKDESTLAHNGIYVRTSSTVFTRSDDFNTPTEIAGGDFVFVTGGTLYNSTGWVQIDEVTTVGTDPIDWDQFSGAGTFLAGAGLDLTGTTFSIGTGEVVATMIANNAVETAKINNNAVTTAKIADLNVTTDKLADNAVTTAKIATNAVTAVELADDAVDTAAIVANAVTDAKIAANAVTTAKILDGNVTEAKLASALATKINDKTDKYSANVGNTVATSFTVTHNLDSKDVIVHVYDNSTPFAQVFVDVQHTSANAVTVLFATAPDTDQYRVVVIG